MKAGSRRGRINGQVGMDETWYTQVLTHQVNLVNFSFSRYCLCIPILQVKILRVVVGKDLCSFPVALLVTT